MTHPTLRGRVAGFDPFFSTVGRQLQATQLRNFVWTTSHFLFVPLVLLLVNQFWVLRPKSMEKLQTYSMEGVIRFGYLEQNEIKISMSLLFLLSPMINISFNILDQYFLLKYFTSCLRFYILSFYFRYLNYFQPNPAPETHNWIGIPNLKIQTVKDPISRSAPIWTPHLSTSNYFS